MNDENVDYDWNLYHDMDRRSYVDVNRIKELEANLAEAIHEISGATAYLKSCGYLDIEECEPEYQMLKSFMDFLAKMEKR